MKKRSIAVFALCAAGLNVPAMAQTPQEPTVFVGGSDSMDFQIHCQKNGKLTMGIFDRRNTSDYQVARNISYDKLGGGKVAIRFQRGFTSSGNMYPEVYFPAVDESCEVTKQ